MPWLVSAEVVQAETKLIVAQNVNCGAAIWENEVKLTRGLGQPLLTSRRMFLGMENGIFCMYKGMGTKGSVSSTIF